MELFNFLLGILPGSVTCFFGLKMKKLVLAISWFMIGYFGLAFFIEHASMDSTLKIILQVALGLVFALISTKLQKTAWFISLFVIGFVMISLTLPEAWYTLLIAIVVGITFGVIAIYLYEPMIAVATSLGGAYSITMSVANYFNFNKLIFIVIPFIVLAILGLYVQFSSLHKNKEKKAN